jgi:hypothetical protein
MSKFIVNCETGEITERGLNKSETDQQKVDEVIVETIAAKVKLTAEAKADLLAKLGITAEEAALLLS